MSCFISSFTAKNILKNTNDTSELNKRLAKSLVAHLKGWLYHTDPSKGTSFSHNSSEVTKGLQENV